MADLPLPPTHPKPRDFVIIEAPYAGDRVRNTAYLLAAMRDAVLHRGETPYASHLTLTLCLDDTVPEEREVGITAGFDMRWLAKRTVVYDDIGLSGGMKRGIEHATALGQEVAFRQVPGWTWPALGSLEPLAKLYANEARVLQALARMGGVSL